MVARLLLVATLAALASPAWVSAQFGSYWSSVSPNVKYDDRWAFTRLRYRNSSSWNHDYPRADRHLAAIVADLSKARVHTDGSNVLDLGDADIFRHPLVYMSEPGFWDMTDAEAQKCAIPPEGRSSFSSTISDHAVGQLALQCGVCCPSISGSRSM